MKLLCDDNLGKLAKYLRMLGYDTYFKTDISDSELLGIMLKQSRIVLTRDNRLAKRIEKERYVLIESDNPEDQLNQVLETLVLPIDKDILFSRCLECNEICESISKDEIKDNVFPYILKTQEKFQKCPSCKRIYWQGSHYNEMWEKLSKLIKYPET